MNPNAPRKSPLAPETELEGLLPVPGARFASAAAGIRYHGRDDVMLAELAAGSTVAGVFTRSATRSAAVLDCQAKIAAPAGSGKAAILINSGNANAFTGARGTEAVSTICRALARRLDLSESRVFTASTGVIGEPLPHGRITAVLDALADGLSEANQPAAARAIMTTDTFAKGAGRRLELGGAQVTVSGFAKGSGMIAPDMATMLACIFTDARVARPFLQEMLSELAAQTFNCITVDSDTSTSDSVLLCATGQAGGASLRGPDDPGAVHLRAALHEVMLSLAHQIVMDGEGASKFVEIRATGAASDADARRVALAIANSPLVKTAIAGEDPNWGRIVMAVGKAGARAERDRLSIRFGDILVAENGWVAPGYREEEGAGYMKNDRLTITVDLGLGPGRATIWTCDLTARYIEINADYRS